jgi:predicted kinase
VVDATFGERRLQEAFFGTLGDSEHLAVIECVAPPDVLARRARERQRGGPVDSEAGPGVAAALLERFVPLARAGVPRLRVDTTVPAATALLEVAAWIDSL